MSCTANIVDNRWKILHRPPAVGKTGRQTTGHRQRRLRLGTAGLLCTGGRTGAVSGVKGYKTQDRQSSRNRCAGLGGAGSPVLSVYHPIRSHLWGVLLKNDEMAIPVLHHLWLSLPDRSFFFRGKQFPLCARCTGELIGILLAPAAFWMFGLPDGKICLWLLLPLVLDGGIQRLTRYESGNIRRLLTGCCLAMPLWVCWCSARSAVLARWGYQLGKQLAVW